jgi:hypothetical protein
MIKFIYRLLKTVSIFLFISLPLQVVGIVVLLPYLPFHYNYVKKNQPKSWKLPYLLRWFDSADLYAEFGRNPVTYLTKVVPVGWYTMYTWLTFRNPINYFSYAYLAVCPKDSIKTLNITIVAQSPLQGPYGQKIPNIGDSGNDVAGYQYVEYEIDGGVYYEYYYVHAFTSSLLAGKCLRFRMGWKLGLPHEVRINNYVQDVLNLQPLATYSGK